MTLLLPDDFVGKCLRHFKHACEKHPKFCNGLTIGDILDVVYKTSCVNVVVSALDGVRLRMKSSIDDRQLTAVQIAQCELCEAACELEHGNHAAAIEELYDLIAVCMRAICVLEGKQELTKGVCE